MKTLGYAKSGCVTRGNRIALLIAGLALLETPAASAAYNSVNVDVGGVTWKVKIETSAKTASIGPNIGPSVWGNSDSRAFDVGTYRGALIVPDTVTYNNASYKVVEIANRGMIGCQMTGLTFPAGITNYWNEAFKDCTNLKDVCFRGPVTVNKGSSQTFVTLSRQPNAFGGATKVTFALIGPNVKAKALTGDETSDRLFYGATDVTVLLPRRSDNMTWDGFQSYLGATDTSGTAIYYGPAEDFDLMMGESAVTIVPRTAQSLGNALTWAPKFKNVFGLDTCISITNVIEGSIAIPSASLPYVTIDTTSRVTFSVSTQSELDSTLAAITMTSPIIVDVSGMPKHEAITVPSGRNIAVLMPEGSRCVKAETGFIIVLR